MWWPVNFCWPLWGQAASTSSAVQQHGSCCHIIIHLKHLLNLKELNNVPKAAADFSFTTYTNTLPITMPLKCPIGQAAFLLWSRVRWTFCLRGGGGRGRRGRRWRWGTFHWLCWWRRICRRLLSGSFTRLTLSQDHHNKSSVVEIQKTMFTPF